MIKTIKAMPSFVLELMAYAKNNIHSEADLENIMGKIISESNLVLTAKSFKKLAAGTEILSDADTSPKIPLAQDSTGIVKHPAPLDAASHVSVSTPKELIHTMFALVEGKNYVLSGTEVLRALNTFMDRIESGKPVSGEEIENVIRTGHDKAKEKNQRVRGPRPDVAPVVDPNAKHQELITNWPEEFKPWAEQHKFPLRMNSLEGDAANSQEDSAESEEEEREPTVSGKFPLAKAK